MSSAALGIECWTTMNLYSLLSVLLFLVGHVAAAPEGCNGRPAEFQLDSLEPMEVELVSDYEDNLDCLWSFKLALSQEIDPDNLYRYIAVEIVDPFGTEGQARCEGDYVDLFSAIIDNSTRLGRFCGFQRPRNQPLYTYLKDDELKIVFKSDNVVSGFDGVKVKVWPVKEFDKKRKLGGDIYTKCGLEDDIELVFGADVTDEGAYYHNEDVSWVIRPTSAEGTVHVEFQDLFLENCGEPKCDFITLDHFATVPDGTNFSGTLFDQEVLEDLRGNRGQSVTIRFKTDGTISRPVGFRFVYYEECN